MHFEYSDDATLLAHLQVVRELVDCTLTAPLTIPFHLRISRKYAILLIEH